ncbi:solute carrier family 22 member 7 isoform 3-T3 [Urocitellus parryii]
MGFEELLDEVGGFGSFQLRNVALMALPRVILPLNFLLPIFLAAVPAHHCALPGTPDNFSHQEAWLETHLPREPDGRFSSCLRFAHPQTLPNTTLGREAPSPGELEGEPSTVPCSQGWEYDHSEFSSTIATEWDLVCERKGLNRVASTLFFIGVLMGAVVFGYLSDRFGRRRLLLVAYVSTLVLGLTSAASVNYVMFAITRTLTGSTLAGFTIIVLPLELEWLDVEHREVAGILSSTFWTGGVLLLALAGYLIRDWRWLLMTVTLPCVIGILSIRFSVNFSYYGLSLDLSGLRLNVYQTQLLFGAVELPSKLVVYLLVRRAGRRLTQAGALLGTALTFGIRLLVSSETSSWSTALAVIGKGFSEAAFTTAYLFTSELYPTVLRYRADFTGGPTGGLFGPTGSLAGWSMAVIAQACLWGHCPAGYLHYLPAARDEASTAARDHPGCGEKECPTRSSGGRDAGPELSGIGASPPEKVYSQGLRKQKGRLL